ncbi:Alpha-1,6-mannosylglycoprotein 6-beta-N-acetylglucosaminyltransferase A [Vanrija pseudolonga]|uniref:Alpha-1,6-mannosylglycoprotein 6-beta-N-acetylglucosaminyltransferase A n=1 Tax=Vanrija pseudolonga TaxID=143232 RepID=A0AAF1BNW8_9TREE|nr:Alpha-1,6-mannosylglycoprotein 6-beta-N-acetylglucosaminyltransferase A [Vanrija pseudolonga]
MSAPPLFRALGRRTLALVFVWVFGLVLLVPLFGVTNPVAGWAVPTGWASDACAGWDPHAAPELDPPQCLRARQFRQLQAFRAAEGTEWQLGNGDMRARSALDRLERCVLGLIACPERPLVLGDMWYIFVKGHSESGEAVWLGDVVCAGSRLAGTRADTPQQDAVEENGYVFLALMPDLRRAYKNWAPTRLLSELIYQYWTDADQSFNCLSDPRCVRAEDYTPATNASYRHDLGAVPPSQLGQLPSWRVIGVSFWGSRPFSFDGAGQNAQYLWGKAEGEEWAWHTLGAKWQIVPYDYPGHSYLPLSIEQRCLQAPVVPYTERKDAVLILAKESPYFYHKDYLTSAWPRIVADLNDAGVEVWSTAKIVNDKPIPAGIKQLGQLSAAEYARTVGSVKAMLGVGLPEISPSPFVAMCKATPVVMPYWDTPSESAWAPFASRYAQHGIVRALGEPYAYSYDIRNTTELVARVIDAVGTEIQPFVPQDMTMAAVRERTRAFLRTDWEGLYDDIVANNGGRPPAHDDTMMERCFASGKCRPELLAQGAVE